MACRCNINPYNEISSCGLPASKDDVARLFNQLLGSCCVGEINTIGLDPLTNAPESYEEAFPDGVEACACECIYIKHNVTGQIYINCTSNYMVEEDWHVITEPNCLGYLTTPGLTPDDPTERLDSIDEAFPDGIDNACEIHYIEREDGILCYSTDDGLTWRCPLDSRYITTFRAGRTPDVLDPTGTNVTGIGQQVRMFLLNNFDINYEYEDTANLFNFNDTNFSVNRSGRYTLNICFQYSSAVDASGNSRDFTMRLRRISDGAIIGQSFCKSDGDSGEKSIMTKCTTFDIDLEVGETYDVRFKYVSALPNIVSYGTIASRDYTFEFLG